MPRPILLLTTGLLAGLPRIASALPDLTAEVYGVELAVGVGVSSGDVAERCAASTEGRALARLVTRLKVLARMLARATRRGRCDTTPAAAEAERLRQQLQTLRQAS